MKTLKLEVIFGAKNYLSPALKMMVAGANKTNLALRETQNELKKLQAQAKLVETFRKLKDETDQARHRLDQINKTIQVLRNQLQQNPNSALANQLKQLQQEAKRLDATIQSNSPRLVQMRRELNQAGLQSSNLAQQQAQLGQRINQTNTQIDQQRQRLERLNQVQNQSARMTATANQVAMYGNRIAMTGAIGMYSLSKPVNEAKHFDTEMARIASLGLGEKTTKDAIKYGKAMQTFGTSTLDNLQLVRDGITAFADLHHAELVAPTLAKMKFANKAMYGEEKGAENEKKFMDMLKVIEMRNGLKSEKEFKMQADMIQQVITATGGRVQPEDWLNMIKTGGVAAKLTDNKAFYYHYEPLVQEMGGHRVGTAMMSAYQNLYQGRTTKRAMNNLERFDLIADPSKVKHDKAGQLSFLDIGAIKEADLFRKDQFSWMEKVLVPAIKAKGITDDADIMDAVGSIFSNRTASSLFAQMYMQREQIHKNAKLNAGADGVEQLYLKTKDTTAGQELEAKAKLHDAYLRFGNTILPIYTQALIVASNAMQGFTLWMEKNPTLAKILGIGLLGLAGTLLTLGALLVVFSPLLLSLASLRLIMATLPALGTGAGQSFGLLGKIAQKVGTGIKLLGSSIVGLGKAFLTVGRSIIPHITTLGQKILILGKNALLSAGRLYISIIKGIAYGMSTLIQTMIMVFTKLGQAFLFIGRMALVAGRFLLANPMILAITAVVAIVAGSAYLIYKHWDTIKAKAHELWQGVTQAFMTGVNYIKGIIQSIDTIFANNLLLNILLPFIGIPRTIIANWSSITAFFSTLWTNISITTGGFIANIVNSLSNAWNHIKMLTMTALHAVWSVVSSIFNQISAYISTIMATIRNIVSTAWTALCNVFLTITPLGFIMRNFDSVIGYLSTLKDRFYAMGVNIIQGLINGVQTGFAKLKSLWAEVNSYMPDFMQKRMDIHSPSRLFKSFGGYIMQGLNIGLLAGVPQLQKHYGKVLDIFTQPPQIKFTPQFAGGASPMDKMFHQKSQPLLQTGLNNPVASPTLAPKSWNLVDKIPTYLQQSPIGEHIVKLAHKAQGLIEKTQQASQKIVHSALPNKTSQHSIQMAGDTININIYSTGENPNNIRQQVEQALQQHQRNKQARLRDSYADYL